MSELEKWVGAALVGTGQQSPKVPDDGSALAAVVQQLNWAQPEQALLGAVGAIALHQQIGQRSHSTKFSPLPICEPDTAPVCSAQTAGVLSTILNEQPDLLAELLTLIVDAGQRVPPQWLSKLLIIGRQRTDLHASVSKAIGNRGRWLAAQNLFWQYAQSIDGAASERQAKEIWKSGIVSDRTSFLQQWRAIDSAAAREALMAVWETEPVRHRTGLIGALAVELSMADEPFLEEALSDRGKGVRAQAVNLLTRLPDSRLCQRMIQRVQTFVQLQETGQRLKLEIMLPMLEHDPLAWKRDGIEPEGGKAWCLEQVVSSVPLKHWQNDPVDMVRAAVRSEHEETLLRSWSAATKRENNVDWANALIDECTSDETAILNLFKVLSAERKEAFLKAQQPDSSDGAASVYWLHLAAQSGQGLSLELSRVILEKTLFFLKKAQVYDTLFSMSENLAMVLHPQIAPEAVKAIEDSSKINQGYIWQSFIKPFSRILTLRQAMHQSFTDSTFTNSS